MKKFVYILTDRNRNNLHIGLSSDLMQTVAFYKQMPNLCFDSAQLLSRLVYFEEYATEAQALSRFKMLNVFTRMQKERLIRSCNTDWTDLSYGLSVERKLMQKDFRLPLPFAAQMQVG